MIANALAGSVTLGVVHIRKPGKRCKMPQKTGISPRFFLGRFKSAKAVVSGIQIGRAIR